MSLEALWLMEFALAQGSWTNGGVVVLETGRIFGGDSQYYYVGTYKVDRERITADVLSVHYHGERYTAFGTDEPKFQIKIQGKWSEKEISGEMFRVEKPELRLTD